MDNPESKVTIFRKRALTCLGVQTFLLIVLLVVQIMSFLAKIYNGMGSLIGMGIVGACLVNAFFGFHTIFYVDQRKFPGYQFTNAIIYGGLIAVLVMEQIVWDNSNQSSFQTYMFVNCGVGAVIAIIDLMQLLFINTLKRKWKSQRERSNLKNSLNKESYDSILSASILLQD